MDRKIIAYQITPVFAASGGMVMPCLMRSMISEQVLSNTGGGGNFISPDEFEAIRHNEAVHAAIITGVKAPKPQPVKVLISLVQLYDHAVAIEALRRQGFSLDRKMQVGTTVILAGEIMDTYIDDARQIGGVDGVELDPSFQTG